MDKIEELKQKIEQFQAKTAAKEEIKAFITLVLAVLKNSKESFDKLTAENINTIKQGIAYIEEINAKAINSLDAKSNAVVGEFDAKLALVKALLAKVEAIKATPGRDGLDGRDGVGIDGKDGKDGKDGSPDNRLQIVEKINTGEKKDLKINLSQLEDFTKLEKSISDRALSILDQRTKFLINKTVKVDGVTITGNGTDSNPLVSVGGGSGTPGGSDTQLQYNNAGAFGGISGISTNGSNNLIFSSGITPSWRFQLDSATFNGTVDDVFSLMFNVDANRDLIDPLEPGLQMGWEGHYNDGVNHWFEWNMNYIPVGGGAFERVLDWQVNRTTGVPYLGFNQGLTVLGRDGANPSTVLTLSRAISAGTKDPTIVVASGTANSVTGGGGKSNVSGITFQRYSDGADMLQIDNTNADIYIPQGTLGIGTVSPEASLQIGVRAAGSAPPTTDVYLGGHAGNTSVVTRIRTGSYDDNADYGFYLNTNYATAALATLGTRNGGVDTDTLTLKSGNVILGGGTTAAELRFLEPSASGTNYTAFKAVAQAATITYSLPATVGGAGTFLKDAAGDGVLSWAAPAGGGDVVKVGTPVDTQVTYWTGDGTAAGDAGFVYNATTNIATIGGLLVSGLTASEIVITDASKNLVSAAVATYPSLTELTYVKGVTSAIQTQLGTKAATATTITIAGTANQITSSAGAQDLSANRTWTLSLPADVLIPTVLTTPNTGLHILDTNASHDLIIAPGSDLTADHTLTLTTGDADRTITLSGNPTLADWFDQAVKAASSPTFVNLTITSFAANWTNAGRTVADAGILTTVDINGGTLDGVTIGGASAAAATFTTVTATTINAFTTGGAITLAENTSIALDPAGSADGKYTGITIAGTAGATLAFGDLIYLAVADSRWELCDADALATAGNVMIGMCVLAAAADGSATTVLLMGQIRADAKFPALTVGAAVYAGETAGAVQVAIPTGADNVIRVVGFALTADEMYFNPSQDHQTTVA